MDLMVLIRYPRDWDTVPADTINDDTRLKVCNIPIVLLDIARIVVALDIWFVATTSIRFTDLSLTPYPFQFLDYFHFKLDHVSILR